MLSIFQFLTLGGLPPGQRSPKGEMAYYPPRSTILQNFSTIARTVYEICVTKVFSLFGPWGLIPGPEFTKRGDDLADSETYHPAKFHRPMSTHARHIRYQNSCGQTNKQTSTPVVRTAVYPHMPIAVITVVKDTFGSVFSNTRYKILCPLFYDSSRHRLRRWPSPTMRWPVFTRT